MENKKEYFEGIFILSAKINSIELDSIITELEQQIVSTKANIINKTCQGIKPLVYQIKEHTYGYFIIYEFYIENTPETIKTKLKTIKDYCRTNNKIIKYIIVHDIT